MGDYKTIVVSMDDSKSSLLTVGRTVSIATALDAILVIGCARYETTESAPRTPRQDSVQALDGDSAQKNLAAAKEAAKAIGATKVETETRSGFPVGALMFLVTNHHADLLVVSNRGVNSPTGRLLDSVSADVARQSDCDVMIAHTVS